MSFARPIPEDVAFTPLPIDGDRGLPQVFPFRFEGVTYHFRLYANLTAEEVFSGTPFFDLPTPRGGYLVVRVEREEANGGGRTLLIVRKVVPGLVYEAGDLLLTFPLQRLARNNLNGSGRAGSRLSGGVARRWA
jgi:hypothetical protein